MYLFTGVELILQKKKNTPERAALPSYCSLIIYCPSHLNFIDPIKYKWIRGELIGKGSFGRVYHALNVATGEMMAVKQVEIPKTEADKLSPRQQEMVDVLFHEIDTMKVRDYL